MKLTQAFADLMIAVSGHHYSFQIHGQETSQRVIVWPHGSLEAAKTFRGTDLAESMSMAVAHIMSAPDMASPDVRRALQTTQA